MFGAMKPHGVERVRVEEIRHDWLRDRGWLSMCRLEELGIKTGFYIDISENSLYGRLIRGGFSGIRYVWPCGSILSAGPLGG